MKSTRREFLGMTVAALAVPTLIPRDVMAQDGKPGANDRVNIAGIGVGRMGFGDMNTTHHIETAKVVGCADVFLPRAQDRAAKLGCNPDKDAVSDYREILDRKDVDAIITATPEQWRSLICIHAAQAGKHIFAEKPVSLTIAEGRLMVKAARKYNVKFSTGSMQRSMNPNYRGCKFIRDGGLGKITKVVAANYESPWFYDMKAEEIPAGLDWERWCGPAPLVAYHPELFIPRGKPGWLSFRPFSGGEMTGWGTHGFDQIQWALGMQETGPVEIIVTGDKLEAPTYDKPEDARRGNQLCNQPKLAYKYANGIVVKLGDDDGKEGNRGGGIFFGEKGKMEIWRNKVTANPQELVDQVNKIEVPELLTKKQGHDAQIRNWIDCIKFGRTPISDCEYAHRSASVCHMLNIARYVGHSLKWDPEKEVFDSADANAMLDRERRKGYELPSEI